MNVNETDVIIDQANMLFTQGIHQFPADPLLRASYAIFLLEISQVNLIREQVLNCVGFRSSYCSTQTGYGTGSVARRSHLN